MPRATAQVCVSGIMTNRYRRTTGKVWVLCADLPDIYTVQTSMDLLIITDKRRSRFRYLM
jgi:hypothetical protein